MTSDCLLVITQFVGLSTLYFLNCLVLKMGEFHYFFNSVIIYQSTRRNIPEDFKRHQHYFENGRSNIDCLKSRRRNLANIFSVFLNYDNEWSFW
jgi:hypothetical protein